MLSGQRGKAEIYTRYPLSSILIYNGVTLLHFLLGGMGIMLGYSPSRIGYALGALYLAFAFVQMYVIMPLRVCPNCAYYSLENGRCAAGLNLVATRVARAGNPTDFSKRAQGLLCHNNLYMAALFFPILAMIPALILNFSFLLLAILLVVMGLLLFRFFIIFGTIACLHCRAKYDCPNARRSGVRDR